MTFLEAFNRGRNFLGKGGINKKGGGRGIHSQGQLLGVQEMRAATRRAESGGTRGLPYLHGYQEAWDQRRKERRGELQEISHDDKG